MSVYKKSTCVEEVGHFILIPHTRKVLPQKDLSAEREITLSQVNVYT